MPEEIVKDIHTLLNKAKDNKWCVKSFCTTCGSRDFRNKVDEILDNDSDIFLESIKDYDFDFIENYYDFTDAVHLIFNAFRWPGHRDYILENWIDRDDLPLRLADYLLYYIVRYSYSDELKESWVAKCVRMAEVEKDISLTETLLLTLDDDSAKNPALIKLSIELSGKSDKIRKLLRKFIQNKF